ncbi:P-loop NTPase family protein [Novipirellula artificiosorum]|uniref:hypothetical protein n=1 Tax=Novipirellula artificiosorum TaxID=2528016 RepID=UPI0011B4FBE7|nr:hypothetical protein [Novipirellula artificiosorum]
MLSDLVLIPLCVSEQDLLQTVGVINLVRRQQRRSKEGKPDAAIVLTRTLKNDIAVRGVRDNLGRYGIPVAKTEIREMIAVKRNTSVMREPAFFKNNGAANDVLKLAQEIILPKLPNLDGVANE